MTDAATRIAKARVTVEFAATDLHDKAHDIWTALEHGDPLADLNADVYDCRLCKAPMYASMDYTHKPDCPYEVFGRAIQAFAGACSAALAPLPTAEQLATKNEETP